MDDIKITELFSEYSILLELIVKNDNDIPKEFNVSSIDRDIWEVKPAHLTHEIEINNSRKLNIKTNYEDIKFKYIPCNTIYAGQTQPNTYNKDSELINLNTSINNTSVVGVAIVGVAVLGVS